MMGTVAVAAAGDLSLSWWEPVTAHQLFHLLDTSRSYDSGWLDYGVYMYLNAVM